MNDIWTIVIAKLSPGYILVLHHVSQNLRRLTLLDYFQTAQKWTSTREYARDGHTNLLRWFHHLFKNINDDSSWLAAKSGHLRCLKWMKNNGYKIEDRCIIEVGASGNIKCLEWLIRNGQKICPLTAKMAASYGKINILDWIAEKYYIGPDLDSVLDWACSGGQTETIEWLLQKGASLFESNAISAISGNHAKCLSWLLDHNCPWDPVRCVSFCVKRVHISCLEVIFNHPEFAKTFRQVEIEELAKKAAKTGSSQLLSWLEQRGILFGRTAFERAVASKCSGSIKWFVRHGHKLTEELWATILDENYCTMSLISDGIYFANRDTANWAAGFDVVEVLETLHSVHHFKFDKEIVKTAIDYVSMDVIKWFYENSDRVLWEAE